MLCAQISPDGRAHTSRGKVRDGSGQQGSVGDLCPTELTPCSARSPDRRREGVGDLCPAGDLRDEFFRQEIYTIQID
jgi:hypothetical protein